MNAIGIIGGSGLSKPPELETCVADLDTPFGKPSAPMHRGLLAGTEVIFLPRHGVPRQHAPHLVNYRANLWKLRDAGVRTIIAMSCVGAINRQLKPGDLVVPDQLIDYTYARAHSFESSDDPHTGHYDFSEPFSPTPRGHLLDAAKDFGSGRVVDSGCYGVTQGPRFETAAEIQRLARDGCDIVGMTLMPEAALARALGLEYAAICPAVNMAAGCGEGPVDLQALLSLLAHIESKLMQIVRSACETLTMQS